MSLAAGREAVQLELQFNSVPPVGIRAFVEGRCQVHHVELCLCLLCLDFVCQKMTYGLLIITVR